jgi:ribosomal protein L27
MNAHEQFQADMVAAGRTVRHYRGRHFYDGPAVKIERDELQTLIRETTVMVQVDHLGKTALIVYPV